MTNRHTPRLCDERGWALVTAILLMTIMLGTILSVAAYVDNQTKLGANSRKRETAFNMAEAAMNMQTYALSRDWPGLGQATSQYPVCGPTSSSTRCPNPTELANLIASPDTTGATWQTQVRDNAGTAPNFYLDSTVLAQPSYDANNDGRMWVRSTATARGKTRTIVELVRVETEVIDMPHAAVVAGRIDASNAGNKTVVDTTGSTGANGFVAVRCPVAMGESTPCLAEALGTSPTQTQDKWNSLVQTQISPYSGHVETSYPSTAPAISDSNRYQLKLRAIADGTYYSGCPATLPSAAVVYIESGTCTFQSNSTWNSPQSPGMVLINSGTLTIKGTADFWGVLYGVNAQSSTGPVITLAGSGTIHGGVFVDGNGVMVAGGTSNTNVKYEDTVLNGIKAYGKAGLIQNTWREIKGS